MPGEISQTVAQWLIFAPWWSQFVRVCAPVTAEGDIHKDGADHGDQNSGWPKIRPRNLYPSLGADEGRANRRALLHGRPSWHISLRMQRAQLFPCAPALLPSPPRLRGRDSGE
ncbi:hypothetical protein AVEN_25521-1 [Araneus ventricosus]|uniref:Uncharacterized protein n=1 Tax=Araneus ventricosus TaxID=182803 RepID=A0A4Y2GIG5_ARAVE|nr:hypothetical protein AVEN_25519-1 [Araneus ventricosus]GBM51834.1 hypothetical protein AVEN_25521-1 [Araneus ventricosus]